MYQGCWKMPHALAFGWRHLIDACWDQVFTNNHGEANTQMKSRRNKTIPLPLQNWQDKYFSSKKGAKRPQSRVKILKPNLFSSKEAVHILLQKQLQHIAKQRKSASSKFLQEKFPFAISLLAKRGDKCWDSSSNVLLSEGNFIASLFLPTVTPSPLDAAVWSKKASQKVTLSFTNTAGCKALIGTGSHNTKGSKVTASPKLRT